MLCFPPSSPRPGLHAVCNRKVIKNLRKYVYPIKKSKKFIFAQTSFWLSRFYHIVNLYHAAVGGLLIFLAVQG